MNIFQITKKIAIFCLGVSVLYAFSTQAQTFQKKKIGKKQHVEVPNISEFIDSEEELPVLEKFENDIVELHLQTGLLEAAEVPETLRKVCQIYTITMTAKSHIFECYNELEATTSVGKTIWIIRRDGTQPKWALSSDDAENVSQLVRRSNERGYNREIAEPVNFLLYSQAGTKAPNRYCNRNTMDSSSARSLKYMGPPNTTQERRLFVTKWHLKRRNLEGHNHYDCYDLMSISYGPGY